MINIFRGLIRTVLWMRARDMIVNKKYDQAMSYIRKIYHSYGVDIPSTGVPSTLNISTAHVLRKTENYKLSAEAASTAIDQISRVNSRYNENEKKYLICYCARIIEDASRELSDPSIMPSISIETDERSLNIKGVRWELLSDFPMAATL